MSLQEAFDRSGAIKWVFGIIASLIAAGVVGLWVLSGQVAGLNSTLMSVERRMDDINARLLYLERRDREERP